MKLAVFDCDGTLVDGQASICQAMELAFAGAGLEAPPRNEVRRAVGLSLPQAIARLVPEIDAATRDVLVSRYKDAFRAARSGGTLSQTMFPGLLDVLDGLRAAGWTLAVATGMSDRGLSHCLAANGIAKHFVSLQTADRHPSKPHPAMLETALFEAGALTAEAVMIGDTAYDMLMARDAGVRAIGVDWGYHEPAELTAAGAEYVAPTPADLRDYLMK
jgi:phosphoglycolate phosphatase